ncbi:hypothetical protein UFOVP708_56 [uncultured Caudovirales phage]|uniref:Uncharacterized protein n=1 Tax=uncultured Caudovirales phage TaxID=2100421 RepID=A0A6J5NIK6_9CAUD|nr:hypothetical protein UFOVP708_56 [uncultured Caudovirales phage]
MSAEELPVITSRWLEVQHDLALLRADVNEHRIDGILAIYLVDGKVNVTGLGSVRGDPLLALAHISLAGNAMASYVDGKPDSLWRVSEAANEAIAKSTRIALEARLLSRKDKP